MASADIDRRKQPRVWTQGRLWRLAELLERGWDDDRIAASLGTTVNAMQLARKRHGIHSRSCFLLSARQVARELGLPCAKTVTRWIERGWLRGRQGPARGPYRQWQVNREALIAFLDNPQYWPLWEPSRIPDPATRAHYQALRTERYLTQAEVAARYYVEVGTVGAWLDRGVLRGARRGNRLIPERALVGFVPPGQRSKAGYRHRRFSAGERDLILRLRAQGWTYRQIAEATGRTIGSVSNVVYRAAGRRDAQREAA